MLRRQRHLTTLWNTFGYLRDLINTRERTLVSTTVARAIHKHSGINIGSEASIVFSLLPARTWESDLSPFNLKTFWLRCCSQKRSRKSLSGHINAEQTVNTHNLAGLELDGPADLSSDEMPTRRRRLGGDVCAIFVHAGAGYHSIQNEKMHLAACEE